MGGRRTVVRDADPGGPPRRLAGHPPHRRLGGDAVAAVEGAIRGGDRSLLCQRLEAIDQEVAMWRACTAVGLLVVMSMHSRPAAEQKLTAEQLVTLHLQALSAGSTPREQTRDVKGAVGVTMPAKAAGQLPGTFLLSSSAAGSRFTMKFDSDLYEGEAFTATGNKVDIANAQPRTGSRSAVGNFVARYPVIVSEGLLGGALNTRWPLLDTAGRRPKLWYDGMKTLAGRELHRLRYRAKDNQGSLEVHLFFDPKTYRHVASVY